MNTPPRILVVDDDQVFSLQIEERLRNGGFAVRVTASDKEFPTAFQEYAPDLVLMDWDLGPRALKTGSQIAEELRSASQVPILMVTNFAQPRVCLDFNKLAAERHEDWRQVDKLFGADRMVAIIQQRLLSGDWPIVLVDYRTWA